MRITSQRPNWKLSRIKIYRWTGLENLIGPFISPTTFTPSIITIFTIPNTTRFLEVNSSLKCLLIFFNFYFWQQRKRIIGCLRPSWTISAWRCLRRRRSRSMMSSIRTCCATNPPWPTALKSFVIALIRCKYLWAPWWSWSSSMKVNSLILTKCNSNDWDFFNL